MKKVHHMVAHMVDASVSLEGLDPANYGEGAVEEMWGKFLANRNVSLNSDLIRCSKMYNVVPSVCYSQEPSNLAACSQDVSQGFS